MNYANRRGKPSHQQLRARSYVRRASESEGGSCGLRQRATAMAPSVPQPNRSLKEEVGRRGKERKKKKGGQKKARQPMCNADAMSGAGFSVRGFPRKILKVVITALTSEGLFIFFFP